MAKNFGVIHTAFWADPTMRALSLEARHLALCLLSGPSRNAAGVMFAPIEIIAVQAGLSLKHAKRADRELREAGFLRRCETTEWVWIRRFLKWNPPQNPNVWRHVDGLLAEMPGEVSYLTELAQSLKPFRNRLPTVSEGLLQGFRNPDPDPDPDPDPEPEHDPSEREELVVEGGAGGALADARADTKGCRLSDDWQPPEAMLAWAREHRPDVEPEPEAERFRDYWLGQPGQKGVKRDWFATWRNWVRSDLYGRRSAGRGNGAGAVRGLGPA